MQAAVRLELPVLNAATAIVYFQRFYMRASFNSQDPFILAQACLLLASKVEETNRRVRDVVNTTFRLHHPNLEPLQVTKEYWELKDAVIHAEQHLLRVLGYEMEVKHPHHYVLHIIRELEASEELANVAFCVANDSLYTNLCLLHSPWTIATACVYLAAELLTLSLSESALGSARDTLCSGSEWWERFECSRLALEDICHTLLDTYDTPPPIGPIAVAANTSNTIS